MGWFDNEDEDQVKQQEDMGPPVDAAANHVQYNRIAQDYDKQFEGAKTNLGQEFLFGIANIASKGAGDRGREQQAKKRSEIMEAKKAALSDLMNKDKLQYQDVERGRAATEFERSGEKHGLEVAGKKTSNAAAEKSLGRMDTEFSHADEMHGLNTAEKRTSNNAASFELSKAKRDEAAHQDPNSPTSLLAQDTAAKMVPEMAERFKGMSAAQITKMFPQMQSLLSHRASSDARSDAQAAKAQEKEDAILAKKKTVLEEVEDRRTNINAALDTLDSMIKEDGTFELLGSHNQDLDRLIEQVATDMAKLSDPQSVARPSEVESVKKNLIESGIFTNRNSTARDIIKNFRQEVQRRADSAYKIRGVDMPAPMKQRKEVVRMDKEGKRAVFDADTKEFIRYED